MNSKSTWFWAVTAAVLFAFIFFFERQHKTPPELSPAKLFASLKIADVTAVSVAPAHELEIRAERTNDAWQLTKPIIYPAQSDRVENLLAALTNLVFAKRITAADLRQRSRADEEFGFNSPQTSLVIYRDGQPMQILLGSRTAPGDEVFLRVVGIEDVFLVDASLLDLTPKTPDDWRDRTFADLSRINFDHITVTSGANTFEFRQNPTNQLWRITETRADSACVRQLLADLSNLRVTQFMTREGPADLDNYGLQPPALELTFSQRTNSLLDLQFGKSPTNDPAHLFARRADRDVVVLINSDQLAVWNSAFENLRDRHLLSLLQPIRAIAVHGQDDFTLQPTNGAWWVEPQNYPADSNLMAQLLTNLPTLQVTQFVKDVVTDFSPYGLDAPARRLVVQPDNSDDSNAAVELDFGATNEDKVYVRRADEDSVYAVALGNFQRLPGASWEMRDRRVWHFDVTNVAAIEIHQNGRDRKIFHNGEYQWSLAPGSPGTVNDLAIEENTKRFGELQAAVWTARGETNLARYGFADHDHQITFDMKNGRKYTIRFGGEAPSQFPYAAVSLNGEPWIFEFPWDLYQYVLMYFSAPIILP